MTLQKQFLFWCLALALTVLALFVLRDILLPFIAGLTLAYFLDPLADKLEPSLGRLGATVAIMGLFICVLIVVLILVIPLIGHQLALFLENMPGYVGQLQTLMATKGAPLLERLGGANISRDIESSLGNLVSEGAGWVTGFLKSLWSGGQAIVSVFALLIVTPVVAFYLLVDWDHMVARVDACVPLRHRETVRDLASQMDRAIAGFIRGQAAVCLILGVFYAIGLTLIGLNFGVLIGLTAGFLSFIPYVGSTVGLVVSVGVALIQFWPEWTWIVATLGIFFLGQFLEGNILSPKLVGASIGLHPVWLMFALFAFGSLFGFAGLLLAVPLAASVAVLVRFGLKQYLASPLYSEMPKLLKTQTTSTTLIVDK